MSFKFFKIPVYIHPSFWLFLIFFTNIYQSPSWESLILGGVFFGSLLIHEYGHAFTAVYFGVSPTIQLEAFGGTTRYEGQNLSLKQQFLITLNGPLFESLLIVIPYFLLQSGSFQHAPYLHFALQATFKLNLIWCLLNLIPLAPLDGGYLARYLLEKWLGEEKGKQTALVLGIFSALVLAPYLFLKGFVFFGVLVSFFGIRYFQTLKLIKKHPPNPFAEYARGLTALKNQEIEKGKHILRRLLKSQDDKLKAAAAEALAKRYVEEGDDQTAYRLLIDADKNFLRDSKALLCQLAFKAKNYPLAGEFAHDAYNIAPSFETALMNSKAFAQLNAPAQAGGWLETASLFGEPYRNQALADMEDPIYDPVRDAPDFISYATKIKNYTSS